MRSSTQRIFSGFTLIELLIVVAIIGIIGAYAFPNYLESVRKGKRSDAVAALSSAAQWMERNFSDTARYDQLPSGTTIALPTDLAAVPQGSSATARYYSIQIAAVTQTTYRLEASPVNSMAGDACGTFVLTQTGEKSLSGNSKPVNECWRR